MDTQEANTIIAEYMGGVFVGGYLELEGVADNIEKHCRDLCIISLDALVPVWGKLKAVQAGAVT